MSCLRSLPDTYVVIEEYADKIIVGTTDYLEMFCDSVSEFIYNGDLYFRGPLVPIPHDMVGTFCSCREYRK